MKKGIYFSFDALIASSIFILAIISFLSYWHSLKETMSMEDSFAMEEAIRISNSFFLYSENDGFGFAESISEKKINLTKIEKFKESLGTNIKDELKQELSTAYDVYITVELYENEMTGLAHIDDLDYNIGEPPGQDSKTISKFVRIAPVFDNSLQYTGFISFYVYEN